MYKRVHQHGGSKATAGFVKNLPRDDVHNELNGDMLVIKPESELDRLESDPLFHLFVESILHDAMKNRRKLKDLKDVWKEEWDDLLKDIPIE